MLNKFKRLGPLLFFLLHPVFLVSVFALNFLGALGGSSALLLTGLVSVEAIYIVFFIRARLNKTVNRLRDMESEVLDMRENEMDMARMQRELIYAGHQIKSLQMDLDALKRGNGIKLSGGNGHQRRIHSSAVSHS